MDSLGWLGTQDYEEAELAAAARLLAKETEAVRRAMGHEQVALEEYAEAGNVAARDLLFIPAKERYDRNASATNSDRLASIQVGDRGYYFIVPMVDPDLSSSLVAAMSMPY